VIADDDEGLADTSVGAGGGVVTVALSLLGVPVQVA
jgi:hypothetical protein